jgi:nucleoside-diphosphate-sugar epimerase
MMRIAVLGANGQVGMEVSLHLSRTAGVEVVPIVRTELGSVFLRRLGLDCIVGSQPDKTVCKELSKCDVVVDFRLPRGLDSEVRRQAEENVRAAIGECRHGACYVFASTTMAFGMPRNASRYHPHLVAWTAYAAQKRAVEKAARRNGKKHGVHVFVFRLGEVHGALQRVSFGLINQLSQRRDAVVAAESVWATDVVFCTTIAQALERLPTGPDVPGTYSLVEQPDLTLGEVYEFYSRRVVQASQVRWIGAPSPEAFGFGTAKRLAAMVEQSFQAGAKEFLVAHILPRVKALEPRIRARYLVASTRRQIAGTAAFDPTPVRYLRGPVPGARLAQISAGAGSDDRGFDWLETRCREAIGSRETKGMS